MADRSSGDLTIFGDLFTAAAAIALVDAIAEEEGGPNTERDVYDLQDRVEVATALLEAAEKGEAFRMWGDDLTGGTFETIPTECGKIDLSFRETWDSHYSYSAGTHVFTPATGDITFAEDGAIDLGALKAAMAKGPAALDALVRNASIASGVDLPPLVLSVEAKAALERIADPDDEEEVEVEGQPDLTPTQRIGAWLHTAMACEIEANPINPDRRADSLVDYVNAEDLDNIEIFTPAGQRFIVRIVAA